MMIKLIKAISNNTKMIKILALAALLGITIVGTSCNQPAGNSSDNSTDKISPEQINANIKKSGIAKDVELPTTIQTVSYKLILSASSGTFNASKNERAANNSYSGSFFYKDSYVFINIEDDSTFLKIFVDKVIDEMNKQAVKAKSEIENSTFVISSNKTSTSIISDDYTNAKTNFNEKVEDYLSVLTEEEPSTEEPPEEPPVEEPPVENPPTEDPTIETPTVDIANAPIVNAIRELGFGIDIVDVEPVEGLYTPETGDLVDLKFTDYDIDIAVQMQLDREKSTKDNLVYKCVKRWDILYDEDVDAQDFHDRYFDKMTFDKENHSVSFFHTNDDNTEMRLMTIRIELDENNKPSFIYNGIGNDYKDHAQEVDNGEVFKASWFTQYDEIEIILAK